MAEQSQEWVPRTWDELFPGRFLKHSHLNGKEVEVTIERIYNTEIDGKLAQVARVAPIPGVTQRDWGLNKTNGICLRALFGDTIKDWFGKRVTIHESKVEHGREKGKPCIRICACADIDADKAVVVDFHTKRIKPFTIRIRAGMRTGNTAQKRTDASEDAKRFASALRGAVMSLEELSDLAVEIETALGSESITRDEAKLLMSQITKREKELSQKEATDNVIT